MKYILLFAFLLPLQTSIAQYYGNKNDENFRVSGDAILRIQPDQVALSLGVESRGIDLAETKEENSKIMAKAIQYCKDQGIPEKYIQTDFIRIDPRYHYNQKVAKDYFSISQSISVIIEDLGTYEQLLTELLNIGINKVNNIEFRTTKIKENRYKVRKMAIVAAKEKAKFLTDEVDIELGEIINIYEHVRNPVNSFNKANYANISLNVQQNSGTGDENSTLSVGMLSLKATVTLTYRIKE